VTVIKKGLKKKRVKLRAELRFELSAPARQRTKQLSTKIEKKTKAERDILFDGSIDILHEWQQQAREGSTGMSMSSERQRCIPKKLGRAEQKNIADKDKTNKQTNKKLEMLDESPAIEQQQQEQCQKKPTAEQHAKMQTQQRPSAVNPLFGSVAVYFFSSCCGSF